MNATIAAAKAGSHPLRLRIAETLREALEPLSPSDLAGKLDEPLGNVSYHFKTLLEYDCVELVKTKPRRGALEHYYSLTPAGERLALSANPDRHSIALDKIASLLRNETVDYPDDAVGVLGSVEDIVRETGRDLG